MEAGEVGDSSEGHSSASPVTTPVLTSPTSTLVEDSPIFSIPKSEVIALEEHVSVESVCVCMSVCLSTHLGQSVCV